MIFFCIPNDQLFVLTRLWYRVCNEDKGRFKKNILMESPKGGGFRQNPVSPVFSSSFTKSTIHVFPSFHDICQNWYSKKT